MLHRLAAIGALIFALAYPCAAQNSNSSTTTSRPPATRPAPPPPPAAPAQGNTQTPPSGGQTSRSRRSASATDPTSKGVLEAFDSIISGIEKADVDLVTSGYWNSAQLTLFNYNGTVTRGWEQMRKNRESSYPNIKDVKLEVRDRRVLMLGRDGAVVTCLWTQSQNYKGSPETASGRMTLVFQRVGGVWKAVHLHTSPDQPDPSRVPASEQTQTTPRPNR